MRVRTGILAGSRGTLAATGATPWADLYACYRVFTLQTVVTGAPTGVSCVLEGSLDGVTPFVLATSTSTTGDVQFAIDKPAQYVRVNLGTLTAGTAPTVTAFVGASN